MSTFNWQQFRADVYADQAEHEKSINNWMFFLGAVFGIAIAMIIIGIGMIVK